MVRARRARRARRNPGQYTYKISGKRPEDYLQDLIDQGAVQVVRTRNPWQPDQEITEIISNKSAFSTKIRYAETADYTIPTRFEVKNTAQSTPIAETIRSAKAAELFRDAMAKEAEWSSNMDTIGLVMLAGVGLYLVSGLVSRSSNQEIAQR